MKGLKEKSDLDGQPKWVAYVLLFVSPESAAQPPLDHIQFVRNGQKAIVQDPPLGGPAQIVLMMLNKWRESYFSFIHTMTEDDIHAMTQSHGMNNPLLLK